VLGAQARMYGLGLICATQAPKILHNRIPGNSATQLYGLLNSPIQIEAMTSHYARQAPYRAVITFPAGVLAVRDVQMKGLGAVAVREIHNRGAHFPSVSAEDRARKGLRDLRDNNRYWPRWESPEPTDAGASAHRITSH
jgi:hypothetical protein